MVDLPVGYVGDLGGGHLEPVRAQLLGDGLLTVGGEQQGAAGCRLSGRACVQQNPERLDAARYRWLRVGAPSLDVASPSGGHALLPTQRILA